MDGSIEKYDGGEWINVKFGVWEEGEEGEEDEDEEGGDEVCRIKDTRGRTSECSRDSEWP
jgi:hypothetical protein